LDQDGTLKRSFFDFLNSYLMPQEEPPTNYKKPLKIGF